MAISKVKENSIKDSAVTDDKIASGITASKLTGALPAISGANLTGVSQFTPPTISSFTPTQVANADVAFSVTITGTGFQDTPRVLLQAANGSVVTCDTVTFNSSTEIVATKAAGTLTEGVYKIQVVNPDGISVISTATYTNSATPVWVTSSGSLGNAVKAQAISGDTFVIYAGDVDSTTISYSETTSVLSTANLELETFQEDGYYKARIINSTSTVLPDSVTTYTFTIRATDASGVTADREFSISAIANTDPVFDSPTGSIGSIVDSSRGSYSLDPVTATDAEGDTLTYSVSSGSLPSGLSLNSSTGAITGTASAVGTDTTSTFSITAEDGVGGSATRSFSITVLAPATQSYTSGSGSWPAPFTGDIQLLVVAAGGGQSSTQGHAGGGGGGGVVQMNYPVASGTSYNYSVGVPDGGSPYNGFDSTFGTGSGTDTTFITAVGGGNGGTGNGGSGGGRSHSPGTGGSGIQTTSPLISANSRTYGFGNNGGDAVHPNAYPHPSGGGGGANAVGGNSSAPNVSGNGGAGKDFSPIYGTAVGDSGVFAGGGGGGGHNPVGTPGATQGSGGSGGGGNGGGPGPSAGQAAQANTGGGGGSGAAGGSGFIIFKY